MPYLKIQTNIALPAEAKKPLLSVLSKTTSELLGKSENYVMVALESGVAMMFAGNDEPVAYLEFKSLALPEDKTAEISAGLCSLIEQELDISSDRIYIEFAGPERHMWGWNKRTFG